MLHVIVISRELGSIHKLIQMVLKWRLRIIVLLFYVYARTLVYLYVCIRFEMMSRQFNAAIVNFT